jgi:hypothetical protein
MTDHTPSERGHVLDLLPGLINGTLDEATARSVRAHLVGCAACAAERIQWEALRSSMALAAEQAVPPPAPALLDGVWAALNAPALAPVPMLPVATHTTAWQRVSAAARFARAQILVVPRGVWAVSAVAMLASLATVLLMRTPSEIVTRILLSLIIPLVTALGTAFLCGQENDPALEVTLATPISPRLVMATRIGLVFLYNFGLATLLTLAVTLGQGGDFARLAALWFGPALLLGAVSLLLSVATSSVMGVASAALLLALRVSTLLAGLPQQTVLPWAIQLDRSWTTSPALLLVALALLAAALLWTPRQMRSAA